MPQNWVEHNSDPDVRAVQTRLRESLLLNGILDKANVMCVRYYNGQPFVRDTLPSAQFMPQSVTPDYLSIGVNLVRPIVDEWHSRLMVRDWTGYRFETTDDDPEARVATRQLQYWADGFVRNTKLVRKWAKMDLTRLVMQGAVLAWDLKPQAPGGIDLRVLYPQRLSLDPRLAEPDLSQHPDILESWVVTLDELWATFRGDLEANGITEDDLDTDASFFSLIGTEYAFGRNLFGLQPGAYGTQAKGVVVHVHWRKHTDSEMMYDRVLCIQNVKAKRKGQVAERGEELPTRWIKLRKQEWPFGCKYFMFGTSDTLACSFPRSLAAELIPDETIASMCQKIDMRSIMRAPRYRLLVEEDSVVNPDEAYSDKEAARIMVRRDTRTPPSYIVPPKVDTGIQQLFQRTLDSVQRKGHVSDAMRGVSPGGRPSTGTVSALLNQGSSVIQAVADQDFDTMCYLFNGMARAALIRYARKDSQKWKDFVGRARANPRAYKACRERLAKTPTTCTLKKEAFIAETPQEGMQRLAQQFLAGRMPDYWTYRWEVSLQFGIASRAGQGEEYYAAVEMVRRLLVGAVDPSAEDAWQSSDLRQFDNHQLIIYVTKKIIETRAITDYSEKQIAALEEARLVCEHFQAVQALRESLRSQIGAAPAGAAPTMGAQAMAGPGPAGSDVPQAGAASPSVGEAVPAGA